MDIKLSDRMQTIADHVVPGARVADIGTDHGYIPIYLILSGLASHVILGDVNSGPLERAAANLVKYGISEGDSRAELRLGSGLEVLKPGDADTIIIAGMGGLLIKDLLMAAPEVTRDASMLILQPRNNARLLREYLMELEGFSIVAEEVVDEVGKFSEIITLCRKDSLTEDQLDLLERVDALEKEMGLPASIYREFPVLYLLINNPVINAFIRQRLEVTWSIADRAGSSGNTGASQSVAREAAEKAEHIRTIISMIGTV